MRGTPEAYAKITPDMDTLYFISDEDSSQGLLYLGTKKIGDSSVDLNTFALNSLKDVLISENLIEKSILMYQIEDDGTGHWTDTKIENLTFVGATSDSDGVMGFVPAPKKNQTNLFLRSDGKWVEIEESSNLKADMNSLDIYNNKLALKNFGIEYYKYNFETNEYALQIVDSDHPWQDNLIPKVIEKNGIKVLGWFEDIYDIKIKNLTNQLDTVFGIIGDTQKNTTIFDELNKKANITDVFTKDEVKKEISEAVIATNHLKRKIISSLEEIDASKEDAEQYIYLILSETGLEKNKYDEYLVIENSTGEKIIEKMGSWETDLSNYFTKNEIENFLGEKVDKVSGARLITESESQKLNSLLNIQRVDGILSFENGQLSMGQIPPSKVNGLNDLISNVSNIVKKLETISEGAEENFIKSVSNQFSVTNGELMLNSINIQTVVGLEKALSEKLSKADFSTLEKDIEDIKTILTWATL